MAYFSNGTEGEMYEDKYCSKCVHNQGCPIMGMHMHFNYDEGNKDESFLDWLIPRKKNGLGNLKCKMFITSETVKRIRQDKRQQELGPFNKGISLEERKMTNG